MTTMTEAHNAFAGQGAVMLDIGGDIGALVVEMPNFLLGVEVEIRPLDGHDHDHAHLAHVAVVARSVGEDQLPSLVFGELEAGHYELFEKGRGDSVALRVGIVGGAVTTAFWPGVA